MQPALAGPLARLARASPGALQAQTFPSSALGSRNASRVVNACFSRGPHRSFLSVPPNLPLKLTPGCCVARRPSRLVQRDPHGSRCCRRLPRRSLAPTTLGARKHAPREVMGEGTGPRSHVSRYAIGPMLAD